MGATHRRGSRLPIHVGTGCVLNIANAGVGAPLAVLIAVGAIALLRADELGWGIAILALAVLIGAIGVTAALRARRTRPSDLEMDAEGVELKGGPLNGRRFEWRELVEPFAQVQTETELRVDLAWLLVGMWFSESSSNDFRAYVSVSRLSLHTRSGGPLVIGETDDATERGSLWAACESIAAVAAGRRFVEQAPAVQSDVILCQSCGAPAVPTQTEETPCAYCKATVSMPSAARSLAKAAEEAAGARDRDNRIVRLLLDQPDAHQVNARLCVVMALLALGWAFGWTLVGWRIVVHGWEASAVFYLLAPTLFVGACTFAALMLVYDRTAFQTLALGFGALAPRREGEPPRCRRCHGPLGAAEGVARCVYCGADNLAGIDLRPAVDAARAEQQTFTEALAKRRSRRASAIGMAILGVIFTAFWLGTTLVHFFG